MYFNNLGKEKWKENKMEEMHTVTMVRINSKVYIKEEFYFMKLLYINCTSDLIVYLTKDETVMMTMTSVLKVYVMEG